MRPPPMELRQMATLCVNIDHIATLRQARGEVEPDPLHAVGIVEMAGSTGITVHLREDRRHIQLRDVELLRRIIRGRLNLEMAATGEMVDRALELVPDVATLVPERREEVTTEGGLDVVGQGAQVTEAVGRLRAGGIQVSLFIDPEAEQIDATRRCGAEAIELHTGQYALSREGQGRNDQLRKLTIAAKYARSHGLTVHAGHGLNYHNVRPVAAIPDLCELNIGHSIISRAVFDGLAPAVQEMVRLIDEATQSPQTYRLPNC
jgi:pyridoxine 5-phosphate synthase